MKIVTLFVRAFVRQLVAVQGKLKAWCGTPLGAVVGVLRIFCSAVVSRAT